MPARVCGTDSCHRVFAHRARPHSGPEFRRKCVLRWHAHLKRQRLQIKTSLNPLHGTRNVNIGRSWCMLQSLGHTRPRCTCRNDKLLINETLIGGFHRPTGYAKLRSHIEPRRKPGTRLQAPFLYCIAKIHGDLFSQWRLPRPVDCDCVRRCPLYCSHFTLPRLLLGTILTCRIMRLAPHLVDATAPYLSISTGIRRCFALAGSKRCRQEMRLVVGTARKGSCALVLPGKAAIRRAGKELGRLNGPPSNESQSGGLCWRLRPPSRNDLAAHEPPAPLILPKLITVTASHQRNPRFTGYAVIQRPIRSS